MARRAPASCASQAPEQPTLVEQFRKAEERYAKIMAEKEAEEAIRFEERVAAGIAEALARHELR